MFSLKINQVSSIIVCVLCCNTKFFCSFVGLFFHRPGFVLTVYCINEAGGLGG